MDFVEMIIFMKMMVRIDCEHLPYGRIDPKGPSGVMVRGFLSSERCKKSGIHSFGICFVVLFMLLPFVAASTISLKNILSNNSTDSNGVCQSKDIRNSVEMFSQLNGCKVVEGFVQIVLIDKAEPLDYVNISFPELKEITGYLLLYRVQGLRSLGKLFPNLTIIRGNTLFINYAFMIFEMLQLQEIGLTSLTNILRGAVYFGKNPMLCFVDTVDWDMIAPSGKGEHHIVGNKLQSDCPLCPNVNIGTNQSCPKHPITGQLLCWNMHHCQKDCSLQCKGSCNYKGECCDPSCLGGCNGPGPDNCFACKNVLHNNKCVEKCPPRTYEYLGRRCILDYECYDMPRPREVNDFINIKPNPYKTFKDKCVLDCPSGYQEKGSIFQGRNITVCHECKGICKKECPGASVDSIASVQKLRGCTSIKGALEIQIRGANMVKELEENMNMIEEIDDYLKIVRSFPLISLNFLPRLKEIHGRKLESKKYALMVLDNQNLAELWDWKHRSPDLKIRNGRLFFHFNPKLCLDKIEELRTRVGLSNHTDLEIAPNSNGDKTACKVDELAVTVYRKSSKVALIKWNQFKNYDPRTLLGYVVYSIEAPHKNVTVYDGRDACGGDGWRVHDVSVRADVPLMSPSDSSNAELDFILTRLKPYTQYAFYVKTYTIASETRGAQSPIQYFRTSPDVPSEPRSISIYSNSSSELVLHWRPPLHPNGNVTHYIVTALLERDSEEYSLENRNYCLEPITIRSSPGILKKNFEPQLDLSDDVIDDSESCPCTQKQFDTKQQRENEIHFEDHLQNQVYVKREKRDVSNMFGDFENEESDSKESAEERNVKVKGVYEKFHQVVYGTSFIIHNLKHYSLYNVAVQACREWEDDEETNKLTNCSKEGIIAERTLPLANADDMDSLLLTWEVSNTTHGVVKLKWEEPPNPNSVIVTYQIEYWRSDIENYKPIVECISRSQFKLKGNTHTLKNLSPGNYSFRMRATSMAGNGNYTSINIFYIEEHSIPPLHIVLIISIMIIIFICCAIFTFFYVRRQCGNIPNMKLIAEVNPEYIPSVYMADDWEVARDEVELIREIGQGSFGMVYEGIMKPSGSVPRRCAVKTVNSNASERERVEFLNEASVMKAFNTHHVVRLLGVVSRGQPTLVIMELMANGDLKAYLRSCRPDTTTNPNIKPPTLKATLRMAVEIADGMAYLAAKKFVHRDLAARNCMVTDELTVKIGDFGMTRDIYETEYYRKGSKGLLPVRWMAPESLKDGVFSSRSDVWSYGVVLYEMATLASQPYQGLSNDQVLRFVIDGGIMDKPENCPDTLYHVMKMCWQHKPKQRPTFMDLVGMLHENANPNFSMVSFYDSDEGQDFRGVGETEDTPLGVSRDIEDFSLSDDESCNGVNKIDNNAIDDDEDEDAEDYVDSGLKNTVDSYSNRSNGVDIDDFVLPLPSTSSSRSNGRITPNGFIKHTQVKTTKC